MCRVVSCTTATLQKQQQQEEEEEQAGFLVWIEEIDNLDGSRNHNQQPTVDRKELESVSVCSVLAKVNRF